MGSSKNPPRKKKGVNKAFLRGGSEKGETRLVYQTLAADIAESESEGQEQNFLKKPLWARTVNQCWETRFERQAGNRTVVGRHTRATSFRGGKRITLSRGGTAENENVVQGTVEKRLL